MADSVRYPDDPLALLERLVAIESVNPDLVPGASGEAEIAGYCAEWMQAHGLEVHVLDSRPGRRSVVGIARGTGGGRSLMLNGHLDTVTIAGYDGDPLEPKRENARLYGRGSFDMKCGVAAAMVATHRARQLALQGDVILACVADEEHSSWGTEEVLRHFTADAGIVTEPTMMDITISHKGFAWFEVTIHGVAAHGSQPAAGVDAIVKAGYFLVELDRLEVRLLAGSGHPTLGTGSIHASIIRGGEEASSYPAECRITIERRTVPGETGDSTEAELTEILRRLEASVPDFRWSIERGRVRETMEADPESQLVRTLSSHAERRLGHRPELRSEAFWTDASLMHAAGIESVLFGPSGEGAHAAVEWADEQSVRDVTEILVATIGEFCG
jgi:acetylornithine deacetylase